MLYLVHAFRPGMSLPVLLSCVLAALAVSCTEAAPGAHEDGDASQADGADAREVPTPDDAGSWDTALHEESDASSDAHLDQADGFDDTEADAAVPDSDVNDTAPADVAPDADPSDATPDDDAWTDADDDARADAGSEGSEDAGSHSDGFDGGASDDAQGDEGWHVPASDIPQDAPEGAGCEYGSEAANYAEAARLVYIAERCDSECPDEACRRACRARHVSEPCGGCLAEYAECARDACEVCDPESARCREACAYSTCGPLLEACAYPSASPDRASDASANVRFLNLSPDTRVDIYAEETAFRLVGDLEPTDLVPLQLLPEHYGFDVRLAGAPVESAPVATIRPGATGFGPGKQTIVVIWGSEVTKRIPLGGHFMTEDTSGTTRTRVRMVNVMSSSSSFDIWNVFGGDARYLRASSDFGAITSDAIFPPQAYEVALDVDLLREGFEVSFMPFELVAGRQATFWFADTSEGDPFLMLTYLHGGSELLSALPEALP